MPLRADLVLHSNTVIGQSYIKVVRPAVDSEQQIVPETFIIKWDNSDESLEALPGIVEQVFKSNRIRYNGKAHSGELLGETARFVCKQGGRFTANINQMKEAEVAHE